jgi:hypothetical protein
MASPEISASRASEQVLVISPETEHHERINEATEMWSDLNQLQEIRRSTEFPGQAEVRSRVLS